jgi:hypothetical protein
MTWTYSADPSASDVDQVRFLLQDTDPSFTLLQDEEIQWLIDFWMPKYDSLLFVAAIGAEVVSRKFAGVVNVTADGISVDTSTLAERYHTVAIRLRDEYKESCIGFLDIDNILIGYQPDLSIKPLRFGVGLHDNYMAGNQDFGGWTYDSFSIESVMSGLMD